MTRILKSLNEKFNDQNKVRDTDRSLFFSGLIIALKDNNFRSTYKNTQPPTSISSTTLQAKNLNEAILLAITGQLQSKVNNLSKAYSWRDKFSFIRNIDYPLNEYKSIIEEIETMVFKPFINNEKHDILGKAYKIFLQRAGKVDNKNIILTPEHIKELMIDLANLSVDDVVLDTCTGTGGFLMAAMNDLVKKARQNQAKIRDIKEKQLIGFEVDPVLFSLACTNMFLHGDGRTNILFRSSMADDQDEGVTGVLDLEKEIKKFKPTKCIINPPYERNNSIKFAIQALKYLESNGKLTIIMPTPTLSKNQGGLTNDLLKIAKLDFVIRMPYILFSEQGRTVNTSIFGFTKTQHGRVNEVLYYNLEDDGFVSIQHKGRVDKDNKWPQTKVSIIDAVFNLKEIEGTSEKRKIFRGDQLNCSGFRVAKNNSASMVKIGDLFDVQAGDLASEKCIEGSYHFITGSEDWKTHETYSHETEAIVYVVGAAGSLGRSHYVNEKFTASNLCLILTPKKNGEYPVNLQFYNHLFKRKRKQIFSDLADGTSKLTIRETDLKDYFIEYIDIEKQNKFTEDHIEEYLKKKEELLKAISTAGQNMNKEFSDLGI